MKDLELNKIAASILLAGLIAMVTGKIADGLYHPELEPKTRGFQVEVVEEAPAQAAGSAPIEIPLGKLMAAANIEAGKESEKKCAACHTFEKGGANKVGPNNWGVLGSKIAHKGDFSYSQAMASHGGNWDYESLYKFLYNPKGFIPGTKMAFAGIKKPEELANIMAYINSMSDSKLAPPPADKTITIP